MNVDTQNIDTVQITHPTVRGEGLLRYLEIPFLYLNRYISRFVPEKYNPFSQMGAVANLTFMVALVTGILLLFWYDSSVYTAYSSIANMPWIAQLIRTLHRYSSDVCILFILLHAIHTFVSRRFLGSRWLAWVSGIFLLGFVWLDGWLGYWLVWDERSRQIALGSAKLVDVLPIFAEPLSRSFLTDQGINTLLFFVIFFVHMMIPLAIATGLWIHIARLNRPRFFTQRPMTLMILGTLIVFSILFPATLAKPAHMSIVPKQLVLDWFFMMPLYLIERLSSASFWLLLMMGFIIIIGIPNLDEKRNPRQTLCY